jgi:ribosomal protein S18 acetylase RimI-like enzyme
MEIRRVDGQTAEAVAPLVADFRVTLNSYKGEEAFPDTESGKEEILGFLEKGYPVFAAWEEGVPVGYIVCRTDGPCLWVEHIFVSREHRRKGVATILFSKAEEIAASMGEDTVYNYVHPNNQGMIEFLRSKGYTVLNLIEIRKPYRGEELKTTIRVEDNVFDY